MFGTVGYVHVSKVLRKKWDAKAKKMFLVGYEPTNKNFRLFDPESKKIIVSCDVKFNENFIWSEYVTFPDVEVENNNSVDESNTSVDVNKTMVNEKDDTSNELTLTEVSQFSTQVKAAVSKQHQQIVK